MIIASIQYLARELGRSPSARDVTASEHCPSGRLVQMKFGTFNAAIRAAGLVPNQIGGKWRHDRRRPDWSNHRWVMPKIDPEKAAAITEAKKNFWLRGAA